MIYKFMWMIKIVVNHQTTPTDTKVTTQLIVVT